MAINYRTQSRDGFDLPNEGNIVIFYIEDKEWWDNTTPTQVLCFTEYSAVNGICSVKYHNFIFELCFWKNHGQNPIDCVWGQYSEYLISQTAFTNSGTIREERDEDVNWIV